MKIACPRCLGINKLPKKQNYKKANCGHCKKSLLTPISVALDTPALTSIKKNSSNHVVTLFYDNNKASNAIKPLFEELCILYPIKAFFACVDAKREQFLVSLEKIKNTPHIQIHKKGTLIASVEGFLDINELEEWLECYIDKPLINHEGKQ